MTANDYIQQKFQTFGIQLSEADLLDVERDASNKVRVSVAMAKFIPSLLLRPVSMGEGGVSVSWNFDGIKSYYFFLCKQYGLKDELSNKPKCTFL